MCDQKIASPKSVSRELLSVIGIVSLCLSKTMSKIATIISPAGPPSIATRRIAALDGLRGLSILLVLLYHCYSRWADILPWADNYRHSILFEHGGLGVNLFFIISGFVIFMTLHNCETFATFLYRRWLRLFPAMCIATVLIYGSADWLWERPVGAVTWADTLPGLLFVDPWVVNKLLALDSKALEGAFWSIFVEVKFYCIFGGLYFIHRRSLLFSFSVLFFGAWFCIVDPWSIFTISEGVRFTLTKILSLHHMGWFLIGALLYNALFQRDTRSLLASAFVLPFAVVADSGRSSEVFLMCTVLYVIFVGTLFNTSIARVFSSRFFLFWGFLSYPFYLIHQNMIVALTIKTHSSVSQIPGLLTPLPGVLAVVAMSYVIAAYGEPVLRRWIIRVCTRPPCNRDEGKETVRLASGNS